MHEENREYLSPPERLDNDTIMYVLEKLASLGTDLQLEPLQTTVETDASGIATLESLYEFAQALEDRLDAAPEYEAARNLELAMYKKVMGTMKSIIEEAQQS